MTITITITTDRLLRLITDRIIEVRIMGPGTGDRIIEARIISLIIADRSTGQPTAARTLSRTTITRAITDKSAFA